MKKHKLKSYQKMLKWFIKSNRLCYIDWLTSTGTVSTMVDYIDSLHNKKVLIITNRKKMSTAMEHFKDSFDNDSVVLSFICVDNIDNAYADHFMKEYDLIIYFNFISDSINNISIIDKIFNNLGKESQFIIFGHEENDFVDKIVQMKFSISIIQNIDQLNDISDKYDRIKKVQKIKSNI